MSLAENYEEYLVPIIMDHWAKKMVQLVVPGDRVLDIGCGTGAVSRHAAEIVGPNGSVVGLDISPNMLDVARLVSVSPGITVDWVEANAVKMPFENARFDVVLCQFALMFMADKTAAVCEMRRVIAPEGRLGLSVFATGPYDQALRKALSRHVEPDEKDFAIWGWGNPDWLCTLAEEAGFEISSLKEESMPSCYASLRQSVELMKDWSDTVAGLPGGMFDQVCMDMESELSDYITAEGFACPEPVIIMTARAK